MFEPRDQHYKERVKRSFASQSAMATMNIHLISVKPGLIEMELRKNKNILQQQGFIHGGVIASALDSACGFAALTLSEKNYEVLTIEFKTTFFYPANSDILSIKGKVIKSGKRVMFCESEAFSYFKEKERLISKMTTSIAMVEMPEGWTPI